MCLVKIISIAGKEEKEWAQFRAGGIGIYNSRLGEPLCSDGRGQGRGFLLNQPSRITVAAGLRHEGWG